MSKQEQQHERQEQLPDTFFSYVTGELPNNLTRIEKVFSDKIVDCGFGWSTRDEYIRNLETGTVYDDRGAKGLFFNGNYRDTLSRYYAVTPDEKIEELIQPLIDDGKLYMPRPKQKTRNGMGTQWRLLGKDNFIVKPKSIRTGGHEFVPGDDVFATAVTIRNSVNGGIALGLSVDTYRQICSNGLMGWFPETAIKIAHYGDVDKKIRRFREYVEKALKRSLEVQTILQETVAIKLSTANMQYILDKSNISKNWLPDYIAIDESKYKVLGVGSKERSLYELTNDITYKLSRADSAHPEHNKVKGTLSFLVQSQFERGLSRAVSKLVENKGVIPVEVKTRA